MNSKQQIILLLFLLFVNYSFQHELCVDFKAPQVTTMNFCTDYSGDTCCTTQNDTDIQTKYNSLGVANTNPTCATYMRKILCSKCDSWGVHLFGAEEVGAVERKTPFLCSNYCREFYTACGNVVMTWPEGSPFGSNPISTAYPTSDAFCATQIPQLGSTCYSGTPFVPALPPAPPAGATQLCVEPLLVTGGDTTSTRITKLVDPNDGTARLFVTRQGGDVIILNKATGAQSGVFLEVQNVENQYNEAGLLGIAFHPNYRTNGRFFVSYTCEAASCPVPCTQASDCNGGTCNNNVCSNILMTSVIAEYRVSTGNPNVADANEVKKLIRIAQPYGNHNGGDILFGADGYLYAFFGDGGSGNDPQAYSQNMNTMLGKALRIDVDGTPDQGKTYKVPTSNPFPSSRFPEIYALGLRNPWRCSFDSGNSNYLFCGDVGQDAMEEFDLIVKGGNYGWRRLEGTRTNVAGDAVIPNSVAPFFEYTHQLAGGNPSAIGGYVYRGSRDACFYGKYVFGDHTAGYWSAQERSQGLGIFTTNRLTLACSTGNNNDCSNPKIFAFGEDAAKDLYIIGSTRIVRVVERSRCSGISACTTSQQNSTAQKVVSVADAFTRTGQFAPNNYGADPTLRIKYAPGTDFGRESFVRFNLNTITSNFVSCSLVLSNVVIESNQAPPFQFKVGLVTDNTWQENTISGTNKPTSTVIAGPISVNLNQAIVKVDLSSNVRTALAGSKLLSLHLYRDEGNTVDQLIFNSKEATSDGPFLECSYTASTLTVGSSTRTSSPATSVGASGTDESSSDASISKTDDVDLSGVSVNVAFFAMIALLTFNFF